MGGIALVLWACGGGEPTSAADPEGPVGPEAGASTRAAAASRDPRVRDVERALEAGLPEAAATLLDRLEDGLGVEGPLLRARATLLGGDAVGALRQVERARAQAPEDGRVLALEVEVLAILDRLDAAREKLRAAWKLVGRTAELERARGLVLLRTPGGGSEALDALLAARRLEPELPFVDFPLAQAHWLAGREALAAGDPATALAHAARARAATPGHPEALELEAEARAAVGDFDAALACYEALQAEGRDTAPERARTQQHRGTALLLSGDREAAVRAYAAARALGLDDEALGFGLHVLEEAVRARLDEGIARFEVGDFAAAAERFRAALELDAECLEGRNHLAVCLFQEGDYRGAAAAWARVLETARRAGTRLPDPVHLNLARAWERAGELERARRVLADHLAGAEGADEWVGETRRLLLELDGPGEGGAPRPSAPPATSGSRGSGAGPEADGSEEPGRH